MIILDLIRKQKKKNQDKQNDTQINNKIKFLLPFFVFVKVICLEEEFI